MAPKTLSLRPSSAVGLGAFCVYDQCSGSNPKSGQVFSMQGLTTMWSLAQQPCDYVVMHAQRHPSLYLSLYMYNVFIEFTRVILFSETKRERKEEKEEAEREGKRKEEKGKGKGEET